MGSSSGVTNLEQVRHSSWVAKLMEKEIMLCSNFAQIFSSDLVFNSPIEVAFLKLLLLKDR